MTTSIERFFAGKEMAERGFSRSHAQERGCQEGWDAYHQPQDADGPIPGQIMRLLRAAYRGGYQDRHELRRDPVGRDATDIRILEVLQERMGPPR